MYYVPYIGPRISDNKILHVLNKYQYYEFGITNFIKSYVNLKSYDETKITCSSLIAYVLIDFGIIRIKYPEIAIPDDIFQACVQNYKYLPSSKLIKYNQKNHK